MEAQKFEALFTSLYSPLCRLAYRLLPHKGDVEDVVQDVFIRFYHRQTRIEADVDAKAYLYRSVYNACLSKIEAGQKTQFYTIELNHDLAGPDSAETGILLEETSQAIEAGLNALPPVCRTVFDLSRNEGLSYKEIAHTLDISPKTVEGHMSKALEILRKYVLVIMASFSAFLCCF